MRVLCTSSATSNASSFDVALTIQWLTTPADSPTTLAVALYLVGDHRVVRDGQLNQRGQILFRHVQAGAYRLVCSSPIIADTSAWRTLPPVSESLDRLLIATPSMHYRMVAMGADTERRWVCHYQNASGTLTATISAHSPERFMLDIEAPDRAWDRTIVGLVWVAQGTDDDRTTAHLLFAPLRWSTAFNACTAQLQLAGMSPTFTLALPDQTWPLDTLTADLEPILRQSVKQSATAHTRRAWLELAQPSSGLPQTVCMLLSTILSD